MSSKTLLLIKVQMKNLFFHGKKKSAKPWMLLIPVAAILYCAIIYNQVLYETMPSSSYYVIPYIMTAVGIFCIFLFSVTSAQGELFGFSDYDTLMALPLKPQEIFISKISSYFLMQYFYALFFLIPTMIEYGIHVNAGLVFYLMMILGFLFVPMIPASLAALIALGIRRITSKMKNKNLFNNLFSVILVMAIFIFSFSMNGYTDQQAAVMFTSASRWVIQYLPFVGWYVSGCIYADWISMLLFIAVNVLVFVLLAVFFSRSFLKINAVSEQGYHVKNFRLRKQNRKSVFKTLFQKEVSRYYSNFMYVFNTAFGMIILVIGSVYLLFQKNELLTALNTALAEENMMRITYLTGIIGFIILLAVGLLIQMSCSTGVSISLEGKNLWIVKTLPISAMQIFFSKIMVNVMNTLAPSMISFFLLSAAFDFPLQTVFMGIFYLILVSFFTGMMGITVNLRFPKLNYDREVIVIKQSMSAMVSIFISLGIGAGMFALFIWNIQSGIMPPEILFTWILVFYASADVGLYFYLSHSGTARFQALN